MLTLVLGATSFTTPSRPHGLTTRACTRMQFEEETTDRRVVREQQQQQAKQTTPGEAAAAQNVVEEEDGADAQRGVRILGFGTGVLAGNLILAVADGLSGGGDSSTSLPVQAPVIDDGGLYRAVLPLVESGVLPTFRWPSFLGGDTIRSINQQANDRFLIPSSPPTSSLPPSGGASELTAAVSGAPDLTAAVDGVHATGASALDQLASALSLLPQPASAAVPLDMYDPQLAASTLDSVTFTVASGVGFGAHLVVPLVLGAVGTLGFELLSQQEDETGAALMKAGRAADLAGQKLVETVRGSVTKSADAAEKQWTDEPARRRMPWDED
tara:strand:+ start:124 stop:1104 length:981 start_codon:yes stop_codon:yes gene_type:complete